MGGETLKHEKSDTEKRLKNQSLKKTGPHLEIRTVSPGEKKTPSKKTVAAYSDYGTHGEGMSEHSNSPMSVVSRTGAETGRIATSDLHDSFIVCEHLAEQMDLEAVKKVAKQFGVDLDCPPVCPKVREKELKKRMKAWKKCPCRIDLRHVCRDPVTGQPCPIVQSLMTPRMHDPNLLMWSSRLPPGTIGVGRHQVAFHGGSDQAPSVNDPHSLELGRRTDGTMCVTIQYSPDPRPPPEYVCSTVREIQAVDENILSVKKSKGKKSIKGGKKKGKKGKK